MSGDNKLYILWTNADPLTAKHMVMMYAAAGLKKGWWDEVTVIIWGATAKLAAEDGEVQQEMRIARERGVFFSACVACTEKLGVKDKLEQLDLNIEIIKWGEPLTRLIKGGANLITV